MFGTRPARISGMNGARFSGTRIRDIDVAEQLREDVDYRRKWCEKIGLGFVLPTNVSQLSQPKPADRFKESSMKLVNLRGIKWSGVICKLRSTPELANFGQP